MQDRPTKIVAVTASGAETPCKTCPLRRLECFTALDPTHLDLIESLKRSEMTRDAGQTIVVEGDASPGLFTLLQGWAFRFKTLQDGRRQILSILLPGDFIGLQQRLDDQSDHGVQALTDVRLCVFQRDALWQLHAGAPRLGFDLTWLAARENGIVDDNLLTAGRRTAQERIGALLLTVSERALQVMPGLDRRDALPWPLTQQQMADAVGLSLVHTHRTVRELTQRGLCEWGAGGRLRLPDPAALAAHAQLRWPLQIGKRPLI